MLPEINFCDWRASQRRANHLRWASALFIACALLTLMQWQRWRTVSIHKQQQKWQLIQAQRTVDTLKQRKANWLEKERHHQQLSDELQRLHNHYLASQRPFLVMQMIQTALPGGMYLDELNMEGAQLFINGLVRQQIQAARLAANLQANHQVKAVAQLQITAPGERWQQRLFPFQLHIRIQPAGDSDRPGANNE